MFYPELLEIGNNQVLASLIDEFDTYLALLPLSQQDKISAQNVSIKLGIEFNIAESILEACCRLGILDKQFAIRCPECGGTIKIAEVENLVKILNDIKSCYICDAENVSISGDDIFILYRLIKKPTNSPDKIKNYADSLFHNNSEGYSEDSSVNNQLKNNLLDINKLYYHPDENQKDELKKLYESVRGTFLNTTDQGYALNDLAVYLLKLVECFRVTEVVHTHTNQFDCTIYNTTFFKPSILEDIGTYFIVECKNENRKPDNNYYHKILNILKDHQLKFGIVFSIHKATRPCNILAQRSFWSAKVVVINIDYEELYDIVFNDTNFLELVAMKIAEVKLDPTTQLERTGLFKMK